MTDSSGNEPVNVGRRGFFVGGAMLLAAGGAYAAKPRRAEHRLARHKLGSLVPRTIGPWRATAPVGMIVATEESENTDGYDQLLTRVYVGQGLPTVMLLMAYGSTQGGSLQLHRPETCYPGQGFALDAFDQHDFVLGDRQSVHTRRFTAKRDERIERVLYWTRIGKSFPLSTLQEYRAILGSVLQGYVADGILVRMSVIGTDIAGSDEALARFLPQMLAVATPPGRQLLIG